MKNEFSSSWKSSVQKRKQKKYNHNAPLHIRHRFLSANLSKELRKKYSKRNLPLRKGDEVLIMRGSFKAKKAKVTSVNLKDTTVYLENIQRSKKDGTKVNIPLIPSNLQIIALNLDDKLRGLEGKAEKKEVPKTEEKTHEKSAKQVSKKEVKEKN